MITQRSPGQCPDLRLRKAATASMPGAGWSRSSNRRSRRFIEKLTSVLVALVIASACSAAPSGSVDPRAATGVLRRLLPQQADQFELRALDGGGGADRFRISSANTHI